MFDPPESAQAYYNENDPYAAQYLRNLMAAGHIAPGVVDERDIRDVAPAELVRFTQCHFFAGVGIWSHALRRAGWPDHRRVWTGSCPCQPFSEAGGRAGFDDERHLWPHWHWLIQQQPPERRPPAILGEQVAGKDGLGWLDLVSDDLAGTAYASAAVNICAAGFGMGWRNSAESERLERAIRDCPDPMVARHMGAFADWADQSLAIGGFHIRQRLYFAALDDSAGARSIGAGQRPEGKARDETRPGRSERGCGDGGVAHQPGRGCGELGDAVGPGAGRHADSGGHPDGRMADDDSGAQGAGSGHQRTPEQRQPIAGNSGPAIGMVNGQRTGLERLGGDVHPAGEPGWVGTGAGGSAAAAGADGGLDNGQRIGRSPGRHGDHGGDERQQPSADGQAGGADALNGRRGNC